MKLTKAEKELIEGRRALADQKAKVRALAKRYASGDEAANKVLREARALASYKDCNCPSQFDSCWDCEHCLVYRVRCGDA